jgi:hypothetical protein
VDSGFSAVYDGSRDRILVFGGGGGGGFTSDIWQLALTATPEWSPIVPTGSPPEPRIGAVTIYDSGRDRLVVAGGRLINGATAVDAWGLTFSPTPAWRPLVTEGVAHPGTTGIHDPILDRLVMLGGCEAAASPECPEPEAGLWELRFGSVLDAPRTPSREHPVVAQNRPNPMRSGTTIEFSLRRSGPVSLRVFDPTGRFVRSLCDGLLPSGDYAMHWDGRWSDGRRAAAGTYFYELRHDGARSSRRLVLLE